MKGPLLLLAAFALATAAPAAHQDGSLEAYLRRLRVEREALHARLREPVRELVERLEQLDNPTRAELERVRQEIDDLGPEAGPILVPYIDPGSDPGPKGDDAATEGHVFRSREITNALIRLRAPGIVGDLIRRTATGSTVGRIHAVEMLGRLKDPRAVEVLAEMMADEDEDFGKRCLEAIYSIGAPESVQALIDALDNPFSDLRAWAALIKKRMPAAETFDLWDLALETVGDARPPAETADEAPPEPAQKGAAKPAPTKAATSKKRATKKAVAKNAKGARKGKPPGADKKPKRKSAARKDR